MRMWRRRSRKGRMSKKRGAEGWGGVGGAERCSAITHQPLHPSRANPGRWGESVEDWWSAALMGDYTC